MTPPTASADAGDIATAFSDAARAAREYVEAYQRAYLKLALYAGEVGYDPFVGFYARKDNGGHELSSEYQAELNAMRERGEIVVTGSSVQLAGGRHE